MKPTMSNIEGTWRVGEAVVIVTGDNWSYRNKGMSSKGKVSRYPTDTNGKCFHDFPIEAGYKLDEAEIARKILATYGV
jgi:hypothetical protein